MTIVYAKRFGSRAIILSDTMISDRNAGRKNAVPGHLKVMVLREDLTVAYAGAVDPALHAIRKYASEHLHEGTANAVPFFKEASGFNAGATEYLVVSHEESSGDTVPKILKCCDGKVSVCGDWAVLGCDYAIIERLERAAMSAPRSAESTPAEYGTSEEHALRHAFHDLFLHPFAPSLNDVGGVPVATLCSPYGHGYMTGFSSTVWDSIDLDLGMTEKHKYDRQTGMTQFDISVLGGSVRGSPVLGVHLGQADIGWLYDPVGADDQHMLRRIRVDDFMLSLNHWAQQRKFKPLLV